MVIASRRGRGYGLLIGGVLAGLTAACGGSGSSATAPSTAATTPASTPTQAATSAGAGAGQGTQVTVTESEYKIELSRSSFTPGTYTFVAKNAGQVTHTLEIDGPGVSDQTIPQNLGPGQSASLTVRLQPGTYELYCPVDGHKSLGMDLKIHVSG